jgi:hypothetical protein
MKGKAQEDQFQAEIGRMTDETIESSPLQSLPGAMATEASITGGGSTRKV